MEPPSFYRSFARRGNCRREYDGDRLVGEVAAGCSDHEPPKQDLEGDRQDEPQDAKELSGSRSTHLSHERQGNGTVRRLEQCPFYRSPKEFVSPKPLVPCLLRGDFQHPWRWFSACVKLPPGKDLESVCERRGMTCFRIPFGSTRLSPCGIKTYAKSPQGLVFLSRPLARNPVKKSVASQGGDGTWNRPAEAQGPRLKDRLSRWPAGRSSPVVLFYGSVAFRRLCALALQAIQLQRKPIATELRSACSLGLVIGPFLPPGPDELHPIFRWFCRSLRELGNKNTIAP